MIIIESLLIIISLSLSSAIMYNGVMSNNVSVTIAGAALLLMNTMLVINLTLRALLY